MEPLLLNLPDAAGETGVAVSDEQQQQAAPRLQRYPELHFLRAMLQLQQGLQEVQSCQQPLQPEQEAALVGSMGTTKGSRAAMPGGVPQQQASALQAAYASVRQPVQELLLNGVAPAALRLPLLLFIAPVLESTYMPFTRADIAGLQRVMGAVSGGLPSVATAVLEGSHGLPGVAWSVQLADKAGPDSVAVNAARLALCRGLARAHVVGSRVQAW